LPLFMLERLPVSDNHVLRVNAVEEEKRYLEAVHQVIACILAEKPGRTLIEIADAIDVDKKTVSNAFNKTHRLGQIFLIRLGQAFGPHCLNPVASLYGARHVPNEADDTVDALPSTTAAIHRLAVARSAQSPGGERITHTELLDMEGEIDAAINSLMALKARCDGLRGAA